MPDWNPSDYLKFGSERTRPAFDLAARISVDSPSSIIDLGCGPGNSTRALAARFPGARILGLDSSPNMIDTARAENPGIEWRVGDAARLDPGETYDIAFSNAALQWIPDHEALIPRLFGTTKSGGALAVQVPANRETALHQALLAVAAEDAWRSLVAGCSELITYRPIEFYYDLLAPIASSVDAWQTTYYHVLDSKRGLIDWYASTGMRPYLDRLPTEEASGAFKDEVLARCGSEYPLRSDGKVLYSFPRIFFIAYR